MNKDMALLKTCDVTYNSRYLGLFCNLRLIEVELFLEKYLTCDQAVLLPFFCATERKKLLFFPLCLSAEFRASPTKKKPPYRRLNKCYVIILFVHWVKKKSWWSSRKRPLKLPRFSRHTWRWSLTVIDPRIVSSAKRSQHIYLLEGNFKWQVLSTDFFGFEVFDFGIFWEKKVSTGSFWVAWFNKGFLGGYLKQSEDLW